MVRLPKLVAPVARAWAADALGERWLVQCVVEADVITLCLRDIVSRVHGLGTPDADAEAEQQVVLRLGSLQPKRVRLHAGNMCLGLLMEPWAKLVGADVREAVANMLYGQHLHQRFGGMDHRWRVTSSAADDCPT